MLTKPATESYSEPAKSNLILSFSGPLWFYTPITLVSSTRSIPL